MGQPTASRKARKACNTSVSNKMHLGISSFRDGSDLIDNRSWSRLKICNDDVLFKI